MSESNNKYKIIFITAFSIIVLFSSIPKIFSFIPELRLSGVQVEAKKPLFSFSGYLSGEFQKGYSDWINLNFSLRSYYIKLYSQLLYSLFNKSAVKNVIIGKDGFLYETSYIYSYLKLPPEEPSDVKLIEEKVKNIRIIQDYYKKINKISLLIITPNKATIYPEYIPNGYSKENIHMVSNYDRFIKLLEEYKIDYVDLYKVLSDVKKKDNLPTTLFSKGGTHWNLLGAFFATEDILKHLNRKGADIPGIKFAKLRTSNTPEGSDKDLARLMGLFKPPFYKCEVPVMEIMAESKPSEKKSIVVQGGSFNDMIVENFNRAGIFSNIDYYWYMRELRKYPSRNVENCSTKEFNWDSIFNKDILILEVNQQYIHSMGSGFPDEMVKVIKQRK